MSIVCQICNTEFAKIIPWQHLRTHNMSSDNYKKLYGKLYSDDTLAKFQTRIPHNKGKKITNPELLQKIKKSVEKREQRFRNGEFKRGKIKTKEQKEVLSLRTKAYAQTHQEEVRNRAQKAINTKKKNNFDFGKCMRGKKHSKDTKEKLKLLAQDIIQKKAIQSQSAILEKINDLNLTLLNDIKQKNLLIKCNKCDTEFSFTKQYFHPSKFRNSICPGCFPRTMTKSKGEQELFNFIKMLCPDSIPNYRKHYHDKEIDIFIPSKSIGIEFNGLYWHSEEVLLSNNKSAKSDYIKQKFFKNLGISLINIFEDEWENKTDIVKSRIRNILGVTSKKIYARHCQIKEVSSKESSDFCNMTHIMGKGRSNIRLGLYHNGTLVSLMTFTNNNISRRLKNTWEINRFSSLLDTSVVGGASKLFSHFTKTYGPETVISYADNRWSNGELYQQLGFIKTHNGTPNYWYAFPNQKQRIHRYSLRKSNNDDCNLTEYEIRSQQGFSRIWDCGSSKWLWTNQNNIA